jgi:hypothetical protein
MQPHPPQLPTDDATRPEPKSLKRGALWLLLAVVAVIALVALLLPKKQVEATKAAAPTQQGTPGLQRAQSDAYKAPTQ